MLHLFNRGDHVGIASIALALAVLTAAQATGSVSADAGNRLTFTATQMDVALEGEFHKFVADIQFDPAQPAKGKVDLDVDLSSVDTGSADGDKLLQGKGFFDVAHFPRARFTSTEIRGEGGDRYLARGRLMLKGRSGDLTVPFTVRRDGGGAWYEGAVPISRLAYNIGEGEWTDTGTLSDEVSVKFKVYLRR